MKTIALILISLSATVAFASPGKVSHASQAVLITGMASSCGELMASRGGASRLDVPASYFSLGQPVLQWKSTTSAVLINSVQISLRGSKVAGGSYSCSISGDELAASFGKTDASGVFVPWDGFIPAAASAAQPEEVAANPLCGFLRCGGLHLNDSVTGTIKARVRVTGVTIDDVTGEEKTVSLRSSFNLDLTAP